MDDPIFFFQVLSWSAVCVCVVSCACERARVCVNSFFFFSCYQMSELQARDLRAWCPLMHAAWSGSADVFRAVVVAIEDNLGRDQVSHGDGGGGHQTRTDL